MSGNEKYEVPAGYYYTKDHEWLKEKPDGNVLVGITDYAAKMLNDIVYVTLPQEGEKFSKKDVFGQVESVKTVSDVYMPVSGTVLKANQSLTKEPEVVASSPYEKGWILEVKPADYATESKELLDSKSYREYVQNLEKESH
ncbi:MAG: glycine cleavage system protein GcvH [Nitrososphaerales archaeon]